MAERKVKAIGDGAKANWNGKADFKADFEK